MITISPNQWIQEQEKVKTSKRDKIKKEWIDFHKKNTKDDYIIFRNEDDELFEGAKAENLANTTKSEAAGMQTTGQVKGKKQ